MCAKVGLSQVFFGFDIYRMWRYLIVVLMYTGVVPSVFFSVVTWGRQNTWNLCLEEVGSDFLHIMWIRLQ